MTSETGDCCKRPASASGSSTEEKARKGCVIAHAMPSAIWVSAEARCELLCGSRVACCVAVGLPAGGCVRHRPSSSLVHLTAPYPCRYNRARCPLPEEPSLKNLCCAGGVPGGPRGGADTELVLLLPPCGPGWAASPMRVTFMCQIQQKGFLQPYVKTAIFEKVTHMTTYRHVISTTE